MIRRFSSMRRHPPLLAPLLAASLLAVSAGSGAAQTTAAQPLGGPALPGVCLLSQQAVLTNAKIGLAATARLKQIAEQVQSEVNAARSPLEAEAQALQAQRASLKPADLQARQQSLSARAQALQQTVNQRQREIEATRQKALARIANEAQPVIAAAYKARNCGLLFDRNSVLGGNMAGDLTPAVVQGLDAKISTITFEREVLPPQTSPAR
jgi:Skp family chaperone for outer membrane proteins